MYKYAPRAQAPYGLLHTLSLISRTVPVDARTRVVPGQYMLFAQSRVRGTLALIGIGYTEGYGMRGLARIEATHAVVAIGDKIYTLPNLP